jgi:hypothetical protein
LLPLLSAVYCYVPQRQVLIRPASKVVIKFLQLMQKHGYIGEFEFVDDHRCGCAGAEGVLVLVLALGLGLVLLGACGGGGPFMAHCGACLRHTVTAMDSNALELPCL